MGGAVSRGLAPRTVKRAQRQGQAKRVAKEMMEKYDQSGSATLTRDEVKVIAEKHLTEYTPDMGGLTEEDVDMIMSLGGDSVKPEITVDEVPMALSLMAIVKEENKNLTELFDKFDADNTGALKPDQLKALLKEVNENVEPRDEDVSFILKQCEPRGGDDPIQKDQLKAALACWYCLCEEPLEMKVQKIKNQFNEWDTAKTGWISRDELKSVMQRLAPQMTEAQLEMLFDGIDKNKDGKLQYEEFVDWVLHGSSDAAGVARRASQC